MREEIKSMENELLLWVNRWKDLKLRKHKYKSMKRSLVFVNERLLKKEEEQKVKFMKLIARLVEARRETKLHITT